MRSRIPSAFRDEPAWAEFRRAFTEFTGVGDAVGREASLSALTPSERQILEHLGRGLRNADIADSLHISEKTVRNHLSRLYRKLGVHSRTQALVIAHGGELKS